jgi:hypothetical protein
VEVAVVLLRQTLVLEALVVVVLVGQQVLELPEAQTRAVAVEAVVYLRLEEPTTLAATAVQA